MAFAVLAAAASAPAQTAWKLVWSDEFNGAAASLPNSQNWNYDLGGGGWGNGEAETYTNSPNNVFQDGNGNLVIQAIRDSSGNFTSARLQTGAGGASTDTTDLSWQYGLIQARIKLPFGLGVWPAFWMLGENIATVSWPTCGEVDIMENFGTFNNNATVNNGTIHGPTSSSSNPSDYGGGDGIGASTTLPFGETVYDDYHVYAIQWSENSIQFSVDGIPYETRTPADLPAGAPWVFNAPFFILLNLAIGGPSTFLGTPDPNQPFPNQDLVIDWVRVYQSVPATAQTPVITPGSVLNAASYLGEVAPGALAVLYGTNLADGVYQNVIGSNGDFVTTLDNVTVTVNNVPAPLTYLSPGQINFQVPWETQPGVAVPVVVTRNSVASATETITIANNASPSMFYEDFTNGIAWMTAPNCPQTQCTAEANGTYQLWANGLGPKNTPEQDGVPEPFNGGSLDPLQVAGGPTNCQLTIGGLPAQVVYCGAAPDEIIDQLNFMYPNGVPAGAYAEAVLTINGATGRFRVPAPAQ
ncbi:MAG: family 16 glycosylhydrolase [Bryobacteraceae bacterium]